MSELPVQSARPGGGRVVLTQISSVAWEHPADRAALQTLRALPGFDEIIRKVAAAISDRGVRHLFTASAVRVGPRQRPKLDALWTEVLATFDWPKRPQLYVTQTPVVNAAAVGFNDPFVVLNSATLKLLDREEQRDVLAHELGHIISGHVTYSTIAIILLQFGLSRFAVGGGSRAFALQTGITGVVPQSGVVVRSRRTARRTGYEQGHDDVLQDGRWLRGR